ncbi:uncharacterized protein [Physcomitrium patens]|uniref:Uncharacterized protein n=1 Tax=Physcomitrium patens TaxID=3218 RepID=A9TTC5_PHYPA|nr:uncharacterized protein LOC112294763 [Physcomitrium patens]PNR36149.1 hypothetical protein PHYPA_022000 [Physcomitrium patens]|eukprot:XP_024401344.1 uncharacterized protein LOC112294763 [Physcomitrella patens]
MAITHNPVTHPHPQMRKSNLCSAIQLWNVRHHAMVLPSSSTRKDFPSGRPPLLRPPPGSASCSKEKSSSERPDMVELDLEAAVQVPKKENACMEPCCTQDFRRWPESVSRPADSEMCK